MARKKFFPPEHEYMCRIVSYGMVWYVWYVVQTDNFLHNFFSFFSLCPIESIVHPDILSHDKHHDHGRMATFMVTHSIIRVHFNEM